MQEPLETARTLMGLEPHLKPLMPLRHLAILVFRELVKIRLHSGVEPYFYWYRNVSY